MTIKKDTIKKDAHYARLRRNYREQKPDQKRSNPSYLQTITAEIQDDFILLYGTHTVLSALENKQRYIYKILLTKNALMKMQSSVSIAAVEIEIVETKTLNSFFMDEVVHQGVVAIASPLKNKSINDLKFASCVVLLDQITDPHNIGAIMRSCVAFNIDALITTSRHSPTETSVLAKTASGALDIVEYINVTNLSNTLLTLHGLGFTSIGLDSSAPIDLDAIINEQSFKKIAFVMGAEGKGLRERTRDTIHHLTKLTMPGKIKSLNVSNATAIALYIVNKGRIRER